MLESLSEEEWKATGFNSLAKRRLMEAVYDYGK
jgi:hypothetical protein